MEKITNFFKRKNIESSETPDVKTKTVKIETETVPTCKVNEEFKAKTVVFENDIGNFVCHPEKLNFQVRSQLIENPFVPNCDYDFKKDVPEKARFFNRGWLTQKQYMPWLVYSPLKKGPFCLYCVLFPQPKRNHGQ